MSDINTALVLILCAYLAGSLNAAIVVCRAFRLGDPRLQGSGNPGATNVLRLGGRCPAFITLAFDVAKGLVPVWLAQWRGLSSLWLSAVLLAAVVGHLFPLFFHFRGGKGVATAFGGWLVLSLPSALLLLICWLLGLRLLHRSAGGALVAALLAPLIVRCLAPEFTALAIVLSILLLLRHLPNWRAWRLG